MTTGKDVLGLRPGHSTDLYAWAHGRLADTAEHDCNAAMNGDQKDVFHTNFAVRRGLPNECIKAESVFQRGVFCFAEAAEKAVKEAAEAMNKQLPKEAQGGSLAPLTEEQEGSKRQHKGKQDEQTLDTFNAENETFDLVSVALTVTVIIISRKYSAARPPSVT